MIREAIEAGQYVIAALLAFALACGALIGLLTTGIVALGHRYGWWTALYTRAATWHAHQHTPITNTTETP